jgi:pimeloyl-ACP methyl ester carboxylesterase
VPTLTLPHAEIYYEVYGSGFPLITFAPGALSSAITNWNPTSPRYPDGVPWIDPTHDLAGDFTVVAMDQPNAGRSTATIRAEDGWDTYAKIHIALIDHLGFERTHVMGGCIGSSFCLKLAQEIPDRITSAVLQNPIGRNDSNRGVHGNEFIAWTKRMQSKIPDLDMAALESFRDNLYRDDFVFSVSKEWVRTCETPCLVMPGNDAPHPTAIGLELAELLPHAELLLQWKNRQAETVPVIRDFLKQHTP